MSIVQVMFYAVNFWLVTYKFEALDIGGSMQIHAYGAYFGLACSWIATKPIHRSGHEKAVSNVVSDLFSMIGTLFLWLCWPSFNSALAPAQTQQRCIINTFLSITGSCISTFMFSWAFRKGKFGIIDVQNATLAGGVGVGSAADLVIAPGGALGVGLTAGLISTFGFNYLQPFLSKYIGLHDTCGVHNLHGMPGVLAGIVSIIATGIYYDTQNGMELFKHGNLQPLMQMAALGTSIGIGLGAGSIAGLLLRFLPHPKYAFEDLEFWALEENEESNTKK